MERENVRGNVTLLSSTYVTSMYSYVTYQSERERATYASWYSVPTVYSDNKC